MEQNNRVADDLDQRIRELEAMVGKKRARKELDEKIKEAREGIDHDLENLERLLKELPERTEALLETLQEMKIGSEPDETADYWEERNAIDQRIQTLKEVESSMPGLEKEFAACQKEYKEQQEKVEKAASHEELEPSVLALMELRQKVNTVLEEAYDQNDKVNQA